MLEYEAWQVNLQEIVDYNSMNMVWTHGAILQTDILSNMRTTNFLNMARKKLLRLFTINGLHKYFDVWLHTLRQFMYFVM